MARLAGFEPTTPWFVAKYSNPTELQPREPQIMAQNTPRTGQQNAPRAGKRSDPLSLRGKRAPDYKRRQPQRMRDRIQVGMVPADKRRTGHDQRVSKIARSWLKDRNP